MSNFALQLSAVYVPFLQNALHTVPLELKDWGLILLVATPLFFFVIMAFWEFMVWTHYTVHNQAKS